MVIDDEHAKAATTMKRLTGLDGLSLHGETAVMPTHVMAVLFCDSTVRGDLTAASVARLLAERASATERFRQRLLNRPLGLGQPSWVEDPDFDIARHVHRVRLPAPGTMNQLAMLVGRLHGQRLDRDRPLWESWVIHGLEDGRLVVVVKFSHAMSDGMGAVTALLPELMGADGARQFPAADQRGPARMPGLPERLGDVIDEFASNAAAAVRIAQRAIPGAVGLAAQSVRRFLPTAARPDEDAGRVSSERDWAEREWFSPRTRLNDPLTPRRSVAFAEVAMDDVRVITEAFGVTVNDVFLAATTSALRRWLHTYDTVPEKPLRTFMPISTRGAGDDSCNSWSPALVKLPVHLADPAEQLASIHAATSRLKARRRAAPPINLGDVIDLAPPMAIGFLAGLYTGLKISRLHTPLAHLVTSNVPGPRSDLHCAGAPVVAAYPMAPLCEGANLNVTAVSYRDKFGIGLVACPDNVEDVESVAHSIEAVVAELKTAAATVDGLPVARVSDLETVAAVEHFGMPRNRFGGRSRANHLPETA